MTKSSPGKFIMVLLATLALSLPADAHLNLVPPFAAIEYDAAQAQALHGEAEAFSKVAPVLLQDVQAGDAARWLAGGVGQIDALRGYAHVGEAGLTQQEANANVLLVQIWGWLDTNGNGAADDGDATVQWIKLIELTPSLSGGDGSGGNVVGYEIATSAPAIPTSTWQGDLLQGRSIPLAAGQSWLLLIRVVDIAGNTSLMTEVAGLELWDNGVVDGVGSDVLADRYLDANGNTPGAGDGRIQDEDVVWVYVPRLR